MSREFCDICGCTRPFEPSQTTPYVIECVVCGHAMVERTRLARQGASCLDQPQQRTES